MSGLLCPVIVNWNLAADTIACVRSLLAAGVSPSPIIVVDNGSNDNSPAQLDHELGESIELIRSKQNLGFAGGNNLGIQHALSQGAEWVLLLNNDTLVAPNFFELAEVEEVLTQLRESIDQLKLTVDAMQETDGDVAALLGTVRYRLGPRLEAAGVTLHWDVAELPALPHWGVREAHQLQMILLEIFSNMIVHSGARNAGLSARPETDADGRAVLVVRIHDDGCGFDPQAVPAAGHGLANLRRRAAQLQVRVDLESRPGHTETRITIALPV